jgi:hypothetical protein
VCPTMVLSFRHRPLGCTCTLVAIAAARTGSAVERRGPELARALRKQSDDMKRVTVDADAGAEVGWSLVLGARTLVGPGVPRVPCIAAASAHLGFRVRGLHAGVLEGDVS